MKEKKYNGYEILNGIATVGFNNCNEVFTCNESDWKFLKSFCWVKGKDGYPVTRLPNRVNVRFHQMVLDIPKGMYCDHVSRNRLDNTRNNLKIVSPAENSKNKSLLSNNKSGCTGVCYYKRSNKWRAYLTTDGKQKTLGYFDKKEDAIKARMQVGKTMGFTSACNMAFLCEMEAK